MVIARFLVVFLVVYRCVLIRAWIDVSNSRPFTVVLDIAEHGKMEKQIEMLEVAQDKGKFAVSPLYSFSSPRRSVLPMIQSPAQGIVTPLFIVKRPLVPG